MKDKYLSDELIKSIQDIIVEDYENDIDDFAGDLGVDATTLGRWLKKETKTKPHNWSKLISMIRRPDLWPASWSTFRGVAWLDKDEIRTSEGRIISKELRLFINSCIIQLHGEEAQERQAIQVELDQAKKDIVALTRKLQNVRESLK